jgi:general secretion pathway protein J
MRSRRREAGFTLLELIVALTLLGMISLALFGSFGFGATVWRRGRTSESNIEATALAEGTVRQALAGIYPMRSSDDPANPRLLFDGAADRLSFLAASPQALGSGGLARFTLAVEAGAKGARLTIAAAPELARDEEAGVPPSLLADGLAHADFAYWGVTGTDAAPDWHSSWIAARALPDLIRIRASFPPGDPRHWPDLVVAPRITVDEACLFDPRTLHCQGRS